MYTKLFHVGERVMRSLELLKYSANKHWTGKRGTVIKTGNGYSLVKWDHLEKPILEDNSYIELAET